MTITTEQRKQIREHLGTFPFVSDALADRMTECAIEVRIGSASDVLLGLFRWGDTLEGHSYWEDIADRFLAYEKPIISPKTKNEPQLTQTDIQSLLNIVRSELWFTTDMKGGCCVTASKYWSKADPKTEAGQDAFDTFSNMNALHRKYKQREKTLVGLITKLKGLR